MVAERDVTIGTRQLKLLYSTMALWLIEGEMGGETFFDLLNRMRMRKITLQDAGIVIYGGLEGHRRSVGGGGVPPWTLARVAALFDDVDGGMLQWIADGGLKLVQQAIAASLPRPEPDGPKKEDPTAPPLAGTSGGTGSSDAASTTASPSAGSGG